MENFLEFKIIWFIIQWSRKSVTAALQSLQKTPKENYKWSASTPIGENSPIITQASFSLKICSKKLKNIKLNFYPHLIRIIKSKTYLFKPHRRQYKHRRRPHPLNIFYLNMSSVTSMTAWKINSSITRSFSPSLKTPKLMKMNRLLNNTKTQSSIANSKKWSISTISSFRKFSLPNKAQR